MQRLLERELELNGINFRKRDWLASSVVMREFSFVLLPEIHEGKIQSYGVLFVESLADLDSVEIMPVKASMYEVARRLANGVEWFVLYERNQFKGLARFSSPILTELELVRHFPPVGGLMIQRDSNGISRFFQGDQLSVHANRHWYTKPGVKQAVWKVSQCVANVDKEILGRILEFSFHLVSPLSRVGAILVWHLGDDPSSMNAMLSELGSTGFEFYKLGISLKEENHSKMISHFLSQLDGATFLDSRGQLIASGVHLQYSEMSTRCVPEFRGTRHTSSVRYSFDHPDAIVVTISEDGPVTVFYNGASVTDLQIHSAHKKTRFLKSALPNRSEMIHSQSFEVQCTNCKKTSMVDVVKVEGFEEVKTVACPTCRAMLFSGSCFSIEARPYRQLSLRALSH